MDLTEWLRITPENYVKALIEQMARDPGHVLHPIDPDAEATPADDLIKSIKVEEIDPDSL